MYASIQKWGNSNAVRLPKVILDVLHLRENDKVEIVAQDNQIVLRPAKKKYSSLEEVFEGWEGTYEFEEVIKGTAGREVL